MSAKTPAEKAQELIEFYSTLTPLQTISLMTGLSEERIKNLGGLPDES